MNDELCVVLCTAPDHESATRIGETLLQERLAACVQYEAIRSQYWWQGELCTDDEVRLTIKTRCAARLRRRLSACILTTARKCCALLWRR